MTAPPPWRRALLAWYRRSHRDLPWRRHRDAYRVWVAEVMLQQTTVKSVLPYYDAFLRRFPDVGALAAATDEEVLAAWSGLGYYHRARNLLRGARHVVQHHGGRFPRTLEAALAVPGVGLYTASAILSIASGLPLPDSAPTIKNQKLKIKSSILPAPIYVRIANPTSKARNPGFDVTPPDLITGIITPAGIFRPGELWDNRAVLGGPA